MALSSHRSPDGFKPGGYSAGMRTSLGFALALFLGSCGGSKPDAKTPTNDTTAEEPSTDPAPDEEGVVTAAECEAAGGTVAWDIGDGSVQCEAGFFESSKVSGGVEAGLCCKQLPDNAE
jgi:hypothetical protein